MNRVLVVDDEPQIRRALRTSLEAHGYEVQTVGTGEEVVHLVVVHDASSSSASRAAAKARRARAARESIACELRPYTSARSAVDQPST